MIMVFVNLILWLVVAGILWWALNAIVAALSPYLAEPFPTIIRVVLIVVIALILISALLQVAGIGGSLGLRLPMIR